MTQRMIEISSPVFVREEDLANGGIGDIFPNTLPLALEIGCGIGDFIVPLAKRHPDRNYLAIDIYNKGCYRTCRKVEAAGLRNVRVMRVEARELLYRFVSAETLAAIFVNCPDPWPKKRHRARRLVNREFLQLALFALRPGGDLFFSTDFDDYAGQVAAALEGEDGFSPCRTETWTEAPTGYPLSKYMRRFLNVGQPIYFVHSQKRSDLKSPQVPLPRPRAGFRRSLRAVGHD